MSSSKLAAVQEIAWTLPARIILASEMPNSAVLMAPAMARHLAPVVEVLLPGGDAVDGLPGVEVPKVVIHELRNRHVSIPSQLTGCLQADAHRTSQARDNKQEWTVERPRRLADTHLAAHAAGGRQVRATNVVHHHAVAR